MKHDRPKMRTTVHKRGVLYEVLDELGTVVWSKFVQRRAGPGPYRSGGPAFTAAAREQEAALRSVP